MNTFHVRINNGPEEKINVASSYYFMAAATALSLVSNEQIDRGPIRIEVWIPSLLPEYGPYLYEAVKGEVPEEISLNTIMK